MRIKSPTTGNKWTCMAVVLSMTFIAIVPHSVGGTTKATAQAKKPNILMIMSDDVGTWNISAYH